MGREWGHTGHHGPRILRPVVVVGGLGLIRWPVMHDRRRAAAEAGYRTPAVQRSSCPQKSVPDPSAPSPPLPSRPAPARGSRVCTRAYTLFFFLSLLFLFNDDQEWTEARREIRFVNFTSNGCYFAFPEVVFLFFFYLIHEHVYFFLPRSNQIFASDKIGKEGAVLARVTSGGQAVEIVISRTSARQQGNCV